MERYIPGISKNFGDYLIPTSLDVPVVEPIIVEDREPSGPFGAKGLGEITCIPTAAAISNALRAATGKRFFELPLSAERIYERLREPSK
jgi:CO/xanthine dehydrogenase Mo-binding subunit